jgi:predicted nucleic acid-binding protein
MNSLRMQAVPEGPPLVVCNTTPLVALFLLDQLELLERLYSSIFVPPTVRQEFLAGPLPRDRATVLEHASWIQVVQLESPRRADMLTDLDRGEAEVIALAEEKSADLVIMDERLGRKYVRLLGLPLTGTIGVLLRAKREGLIESVRPLVQSLIGSGFYLAEELVEEALRLAGE